MFEDITFAIAKLAISSIASKLFRNFLIPLVILIETSLSKLSKKYEQ